ncbi:helix-turn-helix domain-containing protein [Mycolicibacterium palauense]|uniref:hypothetical protein n=1 Tax=Mycolicibacterium palauense TaxID=2034511 RepID=UPI00159B96DE|nr:hypothetical protein [Mycolicibacterium palauense]
MIDHFGEMVGQLGAVPELPGARCRGRHELFDATVVGVRGEPPDNLEYARQTAARLCATCPALHQCTAWLDSLPADQRPLGITAGRLITTDRPAPGRATERTHRAQRFAALRRTGMSLRAIAAATGASEPTVRRALTAIPPGPGVRGSTFQELP